MKREKWSACGRKARHQDRASAGKKIRELKASGDWDGEPIKTYFCRFCGGWHIGHYDAALGEKGEKK